MDTCFARLRVASIATALLAACLGTPFARADAPADRAAAEKFGALPVQHAGRIHPVDTLARTGLLLLRGKQTVAFDKLEADFYTRSPATWSEPDRAEFRAAGLPVDDKTVTEALAKRPVPISGRSLDASAWLMETAFRPWIARHFRVFRVDNDEVRQLVGFKADTRNHLAWAEIEPRVAALAEAAEKASQKESGARTPYETGVIKLARAAERYHQLSTCVFVPGDLPPGIPPIKEYWNWLTTLRDASDRLAASKAAGTGLKIDPKLETMLTTLINRYRDMMNESPVGLVPPAPGETSPKWGNLGDSLLGVTRGRPLDAPPVLPAYAELADAYRRADATATDAKLAELAGCYKDGEAGLNAAKLRAEHAFNRAQPFYNGMIIYVVAGLLVLAGWISSRRLPLTLAAWTIALGALVHTAGLALRMWIQDRPPVTNLHSSAIFAGWGAVLLGLIVERFWKNGVGSAVAAIAGFATLIVAHHLGASGDDSLEVMRAVLDSNFWLATHVVVITLGYSAMFVAGFLASIALVRRVIDRAYTAETERAIIRAAYGALAFATVTSFVGTMLGGVWADQSWGRFWGWDPKENGALLIVLWCAVALHARLGGLVSPRGFLQLLVGGNIVTAWSWFGTNMLGVGLHSYGFTDAAFVGLVGFVLSQLGVIALGWLPARARAVTGGQ